ncbi:MAG: ribonuclease III [Caulobacteraceae bacterium]
MSRRSVALAELEERIGHAFSDKGLLDQALTHASVGESARGAPHNERLEFLGDCVLGLLAGEALIGGDPAWTEGELSHRHAALVSGRACAEAASRLGLASALRLGKGASIQGGRANERILGDAMEALLGAVWLDGGAEAARRVFARAWSEALESPPGAAPRDPKARLIEWAAARGLEAPIYRLERRQGPDHAPRFTVEARVGDYPACQATAGSLRAAEKAAAASFLEREVGS